MYKKIALLVTLFYSFTHCTANLTRLLEIKPSYFVFTAKPMHQVYHKGGFEIQGSVSAPICHQLDFYGSLGYRKAHGQALNTGEPTSLTVVPIDLGLKAIGAFATRFNYFLAIGPRFFYFHQHNNSPYVSRSIKGGNVGLFVNTGFNVQLAQDCLLGLFGEYSYEKKTIIPDRPNVYSDGSVQIGGVAIGVSLGYAF